MEFKSQLVNLFENEEFASEEPKSAYKVIDMDNANSILSSECSNFEEQQQVFHLVKREDMQGDSEFLIYDPLAASKSFDKKYHVMVMGASSTWDSMPSRRNAVVCNANKDKTNDDGVTYVAIPFNNTKLGICPKETLEESFNYVAINLGMKFEYFNRAFNIVLNIFNNPQGTYEEDTKKLTLTEENWYDESYQTLYRAAITADNKLATEEGKQIREEIQYNSFNKETESNTISILEYLEAKGISIVEMLDTLFEPTKNNFKSIPFSEFVVGELKDNELWFNNKCLLVKESSYQKLNFGGTETSQPNEEPISTNDSEGEEAPNEEF
jgi:hypothetical protein